MVLALVADSDDEIIPAFKRFSGEDGLIDAAELRGLASVLNRGAGSKNPGGYNLSSSVPLSPCVIVYLIHQTCSPAALVQGSCLTWVRKSVKRKFKPSSLRFMRGHHNPHERT